MTMRSSRWRGGVGSSPTSERPSGQGIPRLSRSGTSEGVMPSDVATRWGATSVRASTHPDLKPAGLTDAELTLGVDDVAVDAGPRLRCRFAQLVRRVRRLQQLPQ